MKEQHSAEPASPGKELCDAREQLAATHEILRVISKSRSDETPVFDAILSNAAKLCHAPMAWLLLVNDSQTGLSLAAYHGPTRRALHIGQTWPLESIDQFSGLALAVACARSRQDEDLSLSPAYLAGETAMTQLVDEEGMRTRVSVPLVHDDRCIGVVVLSRREVNPFSEDEIRLVDTFAGQAVIAIENVRQFREVQARLEREKASAEILGVISRSRDDEAPVFETVLRKARELCDASTAALMLGRPQDETLLLAALDHSDPDIAANKAERIAQVNATGMKMDPAVHVSAEAICEAQIVHIADLRETQSYRAGEPSFKIMVDEQKQRSMLSVPLFDSKGPLGAINLHRQQPGLFREDEVALVQSFAAQAVIAIENVRQFREIQTRLEREQASGEVLELISRSRDDDLPVFRTIVEAVSRLCGAPLAYICVIDKARTQVTIPAQIGARPEFAERLAQFKEPITNDLLFAVRSPLRREVIRFDDLADSDLYMQGNAYRVSMVDEEGMRSVLVVPLVSGETGVGCIVLYRREVAPFSDEEVDLVRVFAAQAVIAIENVRQFREVQTRLKRESATKDILQVISQSRDDEYPVFQSIVDNAARLLKARDVGLMLVNESGTHLHLAAGMGDNPDTFPIGFEIDLDSPLMSTTAIREARIINISDIADDPLYEARDPVRVKLVEVDGIRSRLTVPLLRDGVAFGCINLARSEVRPFSETEIALIETFAAQAVIAIENAQQFRALQDKTEEVLSLNTSLERRVEDQVGEIERMGKLKRFLPAAVADAVVSSGSEKMLSSHRALLGVLFCDIRGFTAFCETAEPEETIEVLQTYHEEMGKLISAHAAGVDHRMGDGIMVLFNDPIPCEDPAGDAVRLAIAMRTRMSELCQKWKRMGYRLGFGVGVSLGYATVGMVGFEGRFDYTASGTAINLASRLCDEAEDGEILLSPRAAIAVEDKFQVLSRGELILKGLREPLEVFQLAALAA